MDADPIVREDATKQRFLQEIQDASIVHIGWSGDEYYSGKKDDDNADDENTR